MSSKQESILFEAPEEHKSSGPQRAYRPLAVRMRPRNLEEVVGQSHLLGKDALLPRLIESGQLGSILLSGPPGCGKTSLAEVVASQMGCKFVRLNAVLSNVAELKEILRLARYQPEARTLLFIDEIHRFNKAQQDLLLPDVESGVIRLIGATTHNPGFYIIAPLLSRSHLFKLEPVTEEAIVSVLALALKEEERGLGAYRCEADKDFLLSLAQWANGDLRRALNFLETLVLSQPIGAPLTAAILEQFASERQLRYDRNEDEHYDTISAFIKSMRGSDPDASLYWLAKMLSGGEDPRFIARRLVIFASEDVGLADPRALPLAVSAFQACDIIGLPECELNLAHATVFLATAPKSNTAYKALRRTQKDLKTQTVQAVPKWLRDGTGQAGKVFGEGKGYLYSHEYPENISGQDYMLEPKSFYFPGESGLEAKIKERLIYWKQLKKERQKFKKT